ncbi:MAG: hypothetical protein E7352_05480 [Clostridiales bacterium]|nr:hypothetical protein [Clostridiales bacterium]
MKKFLCCLLALTTLLAGALTAVSCGDKGGAPTLPPLSEESSVDDSFSEENSSSEEIVIDESKVTLRFATKTFYIEDGQTVTLDVEFSLDGQALSMSLLDFSSSDDAVATVDKNGVVTGVSSGKVSIYAAYGKRVAKATVNVAKRENRLEISDKSAMMLVGATKQVTATAYFAWTEVTDAVISWQSSNPAVATVDNGVITAVGSGKAEITVSYEDVSKKVAVTVVAEATAAQVNTFSEEYINVFGRSYITGGQLNLDHAANGVEVGFVGSSLTLNMYSQADGYMRIFIDGSESGRRTPVSMGTKDYAVASNLEDGLHIARIVKCTEEQQGAHWDIQSFSADGFFTVPEKSDLKIEFIGDSITAGHGSIGYAGQVHSIDNSDATKTYAYFTAQALQADYSIVAWSGICAKAYHWCANLNMATLYNQVSNQNQTAYAFDFGADIVVVNLGTNESSYLGTSAGSSYGAEFPSDYKEFLETIRAKNPNAYIICLYGMMGRHNTIHMGIQQAIEELADEKIVYNPFEIVADWAGGNGHPGTLAHQGWGNELTAYINTLDI